MNLQQRKYQFIEEYIKLTNTNIIDKLEAVLKEEKTKLLEVHITKGMKNAIDQGIKSLDEGNGIAHKEVMAKMKKKYPNLKFD